MSINWDAHLETFGDSWQVWPSGSFCILDLEFAWVKGDSLRRVFWQL
jgi:hypothetical protein